MNALPIILFALGMYAIAYRCYGDFMAAKILTPDDQRLAPAHCLSEGHNYVPTNKRVLFGHHFAAIAGADLLIGRVLAAQFGFLPGLLWLVIGVCLGDAVADFIIRASSVRHHGNALPERARTEIGSVTDIVTEIAILIIIMALAGLGLAVVHALHDSAWATFTIATTIPIALLKGLFRYRLRKGKIAEASAAGGHCPGRGHHHHYQRRPFRLRLGRYRAAGLRGCDDAGGRLAKHHRQLVAPDPHVGAGLARSC